MPLRGEVIRKASMSVPVVDHGGISFTNYELRLPVKTNTQQRR